MENKRKAISTRRRFEILKRDRFTCQYCSRKPPKVALEIDHIIPVSKGGSNESTNLITACFECNRGKSNIDLTVVPESLSIRLEQKSIALKQHKQLQKLLIEEKKHMESMIDMVDEIYSRSTNLKYVFSDSFRVSVKKFIQELGVEEVIEAMEKASSRDLHRNSDTIKYFCGICWNKIKGT